MKCDVAFPIEGFPLDVTKSFSVGDVKFELNHPKVFLDPDRKLEKYLTNDIRILGVVRDVDGKDGVEVKKLAYELVDKSVNLLQLLVNPSLTTVAEVYFRKRLDGPEIDTEFKCLGTVTSSITVSRGNPQEYVEKKLEPFYAIRDDRKETLEKALSYYRIAICAYNPYQAIDSFFGAVQAIIKEVTKVKKPSKRIRQYIEPIIRKKTGMTHRDFSRKFECYWDKYRSDATHGEYHVNDYSQMPTLSKTKSEVAEWTRIIIDDYVKMSRKT